MGISNSKYTDAIYMYISRLVDREVIIPVLLNSVGSVWNPSETGARLPRLCRLT